MVELEAAADQDLTALFSSMFTELRTDLWEADLATRPPGTVQVDGSDDSAGRLCQHIWGLVLKQSGMFPDRDDVDLLFLSHTLIVTVVRMVKANLLTEPSDPVEALSGGWWSWPTVTDKGRQWACRLKQEVDRYDWRAGNTDIFRNFYEGIIHKRLRQSFGEYYTPDWLCAAVCEEVLDRGWLTDSIGKALAGEDLSGVGVLDPACGSGAFLYHAAKRILAHPTLDGYDDIAKSDVVAKLVCGIDINPVAAETAQVTLLRAMPGIPTIPLTIYCGDALQLDDNEDGGGGMLQLTTETLTQ